VCRGRSHDEYYFARPQLITNEPTPKPYLALQRAEIFCRALRSEVLRLACAELGPSLVQNRLITDRTNNPHGQFGLADEWPAIRHLVTKWIKERPSEIESAARGLATFAPAEVRAQDWVSWVQEDLVRTVDGVCQADSGHLELSQRLAEAGVLPMFGFPTHVRYLHLNRPANSRPWPPAKVIDRDLAMAVSQFSPLSEVVRDGQVYPVVGIAAFRPVGNRPQPEADPLGISRKIAVCRTCAHLSDSPAADDDMPGPCPRCSAPPGVFQSMDLREPLGFRAGRAEDFNGNFSWSARAMAARAMTDLTKLSKVTHSGLSAFSGPGTRYVINDNAGNLHRFRQATWADWGGVVSVDAIDKGLLPDSAATGDVLAVALGAAQPTDFLFVGSDEPVLPDAGIRLDLDVSTVQPSGASEGSEARRAAWYSLAFLLRTAAAAHLDVQTLELSAGIYNGLVGDRPTMLAFIADTLENGAGFSTHLGEDDVFAKLVEDRISSYLRELEDPAHAAECAASCYRCLRDYSNMAYHALLDWRLARDLLTVIRAGRLDIEETREAQILGSWAQAYNAELVADLPCAAAVWDSPIDGQVVVLAKHPLEASEKTFMAQRLADALAEAEDRYPDAAAIVFADTFTLDRSPGRVVELVREAIIG
jgi:hypothetical protein